MTPTTIYLRTEAGRIEIHEKKSGLTQSERLVLIMIDGVANCEQVQQKLSSLTAERFSRALKTLLKKELISEVLLQVEAQAAEEIDQSIVERYLHQDPMDPVTIISFNPEDEFDDIVDAKATTASHSPSVPELTQVVSTPAIDVAHAKLADELHDELAARNLEWKRKQAGQQGSLDSLRRRSESHTSVSAKAALQAENGSSTPVSMVPETSKLLPQSSADSTCSLDAKKPAFISRLATLHWGYWMIAIGSLFILSFLVMQMFKH